MTTGLTPFLLAMFRTPDERLAGASPEKLAARYGIPADWARHYLSVWMAR
jgi:hypothetical protein